MKAKKRYLKMFYGLPEEARGELVYDFTNHPMTLKVVTKEIEADSPLGIKILAKLGYVDSY